MLLKMLAMFSTKWNYYNAIHPGMKFWCLANADEYCVPMRHLNNNGYPNLSYLHQESAGFKQYITSQ
jgi:hypothetical protein